MPSPHPNHCTWCKKPADLRTRQAVTLSNGDRLHHRCHMLLIADIVAKVTRPVVIQLPPSFRRKRPH